MFSTSEGESKFVLIPNVQSQVWQAYKDHQDCFWKAEEVDLGADKAQFDNLNSGEQHFIKTVLAFFAASDGIVGENLAARFYSEVEDSKVRAFYAFQLAMEMIHSEMYSLLLLQYIEDKTERENLLNAISTVPIVKKKADWALKWLSSDMNFATRLVAFAVVEGIFFSSSFCAIYWLKQRGIMPGLTFSNEYIARDEGMHVDFACLLFGMVQLQPRREDVEQIVREAVDIEVEFTTEALPSELIGMNSKLMSQYVRFVADRLMQSLGFSAIYRDTNPFDFMEKISLKKKSNFFEKRVAEYKKSSKVVGISFDADF